MRTIKVRCPVCRGTGTRGYGVWHILSQCAVCDGSGKVEAHKRRESRSEWQANRELAESREVRS